MSSADNPAVSLSVTTVARPDLDDDVPVAFPDVPPTPTVTSPGDDAARPARMRRGSGSGAGLPPPPSDAAVLTAAAAAASLTALHAPPSASVPATISMGTGNPDDDIIPTAIVIKNIPFAMKREQLILIIDELRLPQPYALNYHFENGAFRGLAFANFRSPVEADLVVKGLNGYTALGRDIRVEYKKVLPAEEAARKEALRRASILALDDRVPEFDLSDPATRALYEKMVHFRDDKTRFELIFAKTITGPERKLVRAIGQRLGFFYRTEDNGEERFFKVARKPAAPVTLKDKIPRKYSLAAGPPPAGLGAGISALPSLFSGSTTAATSTLSGMTPTLGTGIPAGLAIPDHRVSAAVATLRAAEAGRIRAYSMGNQDVLGGAAQRPAFRKNSMMSGVPPPGFVSSLGSAAGPQAASAAIAGALRQPKGPETTLVSSYAAQRKGSLNPGAPPFNVQEVQAAVAAATAQKRTLDIVDPRKSEVNGAEF